MSTTTATFEIPKTATQPCAPDQGLQMERRLAAMEEALRKIYVFEGQRFLRELLSSPAYADPRRLERFGHKVCSQQDEDGMICEIFRRIGTTNRCFVEIGVGDGFENNTLNLLYEGWGGVWVDGCATSMAAIRSRYAEWLAARRLAVQQQFVTCENVEALLASFALPDDLDLLSIDVDGNDYYLWQTINQLHPRVVVVEYNAKFVPPTRWVQNYHPDSTWNGTDAFGASLASLTALAETKGYRLVGCSITGVNAFFVREDLLGGHFQAPFTAENFYHPPRYNLIPCFRDGHAPGYRAGSPL